MTNEVRNTIKNILKKLVSDISIYCINCNHNNCHKCLVNILDATIENENVMWEAME
ncbi:MAG: hypothetical protein Ta2B_09330 [Termitinemataceae bacterium]|nr:MAG: hypothetical protein Ta2B_09330 [Termitinemataceae bacterium]